jgi:hypothetical protein
MLDSCMITPSVISRLTDPMHLPTRAEVTDAFRPVLPFFLADACMSSEVVVQAIISTTQAGGE